MVIYWRKFLWNASNRRYFSTDYRPFCNFFPPIRRYRRKISAKTSARVVYQFIGSHKFGVMVWLYSISNSKFDDSLFEVHLTEDQSPFVNGPDFPKMSVVLYFFLTWLCYTHSGKLLATMECIPQFVKVIYGQPKGTFQLTRKHYQSQ